MTVLLVFGLFIVIATAHNITFLDVPRYADPRREVDLICHYMSEKDEPPLHSVKWYRETFEIFRFVPGAKPLTRTFNTSTSGITRSACDSNKCSISVVLPKKYNTEMLFTCEVSAEGPRFAVTKQTKLLTIAIILKEDPVISGVPGSVQVGDEVVLNCTTTPALPPAHLRWYIDSVPEATNNIRNFSGYDMYEPQASWRTLRVRVTSVRNSIAIRCEAEQSTKPPYRRSAAVNLLIVKSPHLSMFTASGSHTKAVEAVLVSQCVLLHYLFYKYSALSEV